MVIIEGPDGAGKSTLVKQVCDELKLEVGTRGTKNRDLLWTVTVSDTMRALGMAVTGQAPPKVWDRLYYSEFVYAPIQGRDVAFNLMHQRHINAVLDVLKPPRIMCLPPWEIVEANAGKVHQMDGVNDNLEKIYRFYSRMYQQNHNFDSYDYTKDSIEQVFDIIGAHITKRKMREPYA